MNLALAMRVGNGVLNVNDAVLLCLSTPGRNEAGRAGIWR
jgi:hypothetical protein